MPSRSIDIDGTRWSASPTGFVTPSDGDEFGVLFVRLTSAPREVRVSRYSPQWTRSREQALAQLTDGQLRELFAQSQPSFTSPEAGYTP